MNDRLIMQCAPAVFAPPCGVEPFDVLLGGGTVIDWLPRRGAPNSDLIHSV